VDTGFFLQRQKSFPLCCYFFDLIKKSFNLGCQGEPSTARSEEGMTYPSPLAVQARREEGIQEPLPLADAR